MPVKIMRIKQYCITLILLLYGVGIARSQEARTEFRVDFRAGSAMVEPEFADNAERLAEIAAFIERANRGEAVEIVGVTFGGSTSLEGSKEFNERLTELRRQALEAYFRERIHLPEGIISYNDYYIGWDQLREQIARSDFQYRNEVLKIIDEKSVITKYYDNLTIDYRILKLKKLYRGRVWKLLNDEFFPAMRYTEAVFLIRNGKEDSATAKAVTAVEQTAARTDETAAADSSAASGQPAPDSSAATIRDAAAALAATDEESRSCDQRLAIKTNLVYDAVLMPSLEIEYKINGHWSVALEGDVAWWKNDPKHKYYQIATISPEVRYKFNADRPWHGGYLGLFTGGSWYDVENGGRGYRGELGMLGVSYNYMWPVGRRLSFEAGIGVGLMYTRYKEYLPIDGHYVYQQTSELFFAGPLKLKFALVWRLWDQNCKGRK